MDAGMILLLVAAGFAVYGYRTSNTGKILGAVVAFFMIGTPVGFLVAGMSTGAPLAWGLVLILTIACIYITKREHETRLRKRKQLKEEKDIQS